MDIASVYAEASDYRLGAGDGSRWFEKRGHGDVQQRRAERDKKTETNIGESCDEDHVRHHRRWNLHLYLEDNPMDVIIRDLEGVRIWIGNYELQSRQVGELVGNPPRKSLVAAVQDAIQDPHRLRELERKVDHLTVEKRKTTKRVRKLEAEQEKLFK